MHEYTLNKMKLNSISSKELIDNVLNWSMRKESKAIFFANVHMNIECYNSEYIRNFINKGDIICPDGMPLVWWLRRHGSKYQERLDGPNIMLKICKLAEDNKIKIGLYGSDTITLKKLEEKLSIQFPDLNIVFSYSPPFKQVKLDEEKVVIENIKNNDVQILFVALGCPKQEKWIIENKNKLNCVMLGVGAAFMFNSGIIKRAPLFIQKIGLEWLFRLVNEPKRLWKRYLYTNSKFLFLIIKELLNNAFKMGSNL